MKVYLDDIRPCPDGYTLAGTYDAFIVIIAQYHAESGVLPEEISFDHDLGDETPSGYDCANFLLNFWRDHSHVNPTLSLPICRIHSMNPVGRENLKQLLHSAGAKLIL